MSVAGWDPTPTPGWGPPRWAFPTDPACVTVTLQGITMTSQFGSMYGLTSPLEGWTEGADPQGDASAFPAADGGVALPVWMGPRSITIEGEIETDSHAELEREVARLGTVLSNPRWDWLRVDETALGLSRQIQVRRARRPLITRSSHTSAIFTLVLQAATYPLLAAEESTMRLKPGQSQVAENTGDYNADLYATLVGPLSGIQIARAGHPGGWWYYSESLKAGETRQVDFSRRIVRNPANSKHSRLLASGIWHDLLPGKTAVTFRGSGSGYVDLRWRSAWN